MLVFLDDIYFGSVETELGSKSKKSQESEMAGISIQFSSWCKKERISEDLEPIFGQL